MNRHKTKIILFFILIFICSCASIISREYSPYIWLTNSSKFFLLNPEYIETPLDHLQFISASFGGRNFQSLVLVKADETGLDMTLINEMGVSMGELIWRNGVISFSSAVFPRSARPEYIIADFQLCFYNPIALASALNDIGLSFIETIDGRRIYDGDVIIIEITRTQNTVILTNHLRGYSFTLEGDFQ